MDDKSRANQVKATTAPREPLRQAASPRQNGSPQAVEATLASISEEVTADAIERRRIKQKLG